jgi:hypothetical protein
MECLEVRRLLTTDPNQRDDALVMHLHECNSCAAFSQQLQLEAHQVEKALQLDVPQGLAERILLNQSTVIRTRRRQRIGLALAATVVLSVGVSFGLLRNGMQDGLQEAVIAHVKAEPEHLSSQQITSLTDLNALMNKHGARLSHSVGTVNYAGSCVIRRTKGVHLVVDAEGKPVTVLYMPDETVSHSEAFVGQQFRGVILPTGKGSLAIVGQDDSSVQEVSQRFESALHYF